MVCKSCGKKSARLIFIEIHDGNQIIEAHYCWKCVEKKPEIKRILDTILRVKKPVSVRKKKCVFCGSTLKDLKRSGFVGCAMCYKSFRQHIRKEIKKIHSNFFHRGKTPFNDSSEQSFFNNLEERMKMAVEKQDLEEISKIRKELEIFLKNV